MKTKLETIRLGVQTTLDELVSEHLIPFRLIAHGVNANGPGEYTVPFYDSRIHSFGFSWTDGGGSRFKDVVRSAILKRVKSYRRENECLAARLDHTRVGIAKTC